jgi:hypothetical protein
MESTDNAFMVGYDNPALTLELLDALDAMGFPDSAFRVIHHFKAPTTVAAHRRYCEDLVDEEGRFRTNTNRLVQRRLELISDMCRAGKLAKLSVEQFEYLAHVAVLEHLHDTRPLHLQFKENGGGKNGA